MLPYWSFWERSVPYDLRREREGLLARASGALGAAAEVVASVTVASGAEAAAAAVLAQDRGAEVVVVLQTLAVPPDTTLAALDSLAELPVVVWALHREARLAESFGHAAITSEGATVGTPMLTSTLVRAGRVFELVLGRLDDASALDRLRVLLTAAAAARRLARSRVGRIGRPLPGYSCVDADDTRLRAETGITPVAIDPVEVEELYRAVDDRRVAELERETRVAYEVSPEAEGAVLERSLRAACALEDLVARHALDAAAMNCHVPEIRFGAEIGIAPCYGLGRLTSRGVPWSCVGDVLTAVAMLVLKLLGAAAQYHELESLDWETGELVIASSGEHDLAFGDGQRPRLVKNRWFEHDPQTGACACFAARPGPATLVGFAQLDRPPRYRLITARGELTSRSFPATGTANGAFRFAAGPAPEAWERWCRAGVSHHSAATPGDYAAQVETVARFLGVEAVAV